MSRNLMFPVVVALVPAFVAVAADPKDDVRAAAKKLADSPNYSWKTTVEGGARNAGGTEGKIEKEGFTWYTVSQRNNTMEVVLKGDKGAVKTAEGWKSLEEAAAAPAGAGTPNPARNLARQAKNFKSPAAQIEELAGKATDLKAADGGAIAGTLPEDAVKPMLAAGGRRRGAGGAAAAAPTVTNAKGSVKFWIKDGVLTKYEVNAQGSVNANGQDREVNRTTTTEFTDVGTTKIEVPAEAKAKLGA